MQDSLGEINRMNTTHSFSLLEESFDLTHDICQLASELQNKVYSPLASQMIFSTKSVIDNLVKELNNSSAITAFNGAQGIVNLVKEIIVCLHMARRELLIDKENFHELHRRCEKFLNNVSTYFGSSRRVVVRLF